MSDIAACMVSVLTLIAEALKGIIFIDEHECYLLKIAILLHKCSPDVHLLLVPGSVNQISKVLL